MASTQNRDEFIADFSQYVEASPTSWHAVADLARRLVDEGFSERSENAGWEACEANERGFIRRDGALIAWRAGAGPSKSSAFRVLGAHSDSPGFVLKPGTDRDRCGLAQTSVEVYGGALLHTWLDRDLAIAGRVIFRDGSEELVCSGPVARIPNLAIHLDRTLNDKLELDRQQHLQPIIGDTGTTVSDVLRSGGIDPDQVQGAELRLVDTQAPAQLGIDGELFVSGRLDNLTSVYAGFVALSKAEVPDNEILVLAVFDHEELGSETRSGAAGPLLRDVTDRILYTMGATPDDIARSAAKTWVLSSDVGHAIHPNYPEKHDPDVHPVLGGGPVLKRNANQRYATDAHGEALWHRVCERADVPSQLLISKNTVPCGSTIGPLTAARTGFRTVDVGAPLLSMHSVREVAHVRDLIQLTDAVQAFFEIGAR